MTINNLKVINDRYIAEEQRRAIIERAEKKASTYNSAKKIFQMAESGECIKHGNGYIDVVLHGQNIIYFLSLLRGTKLFRKYDNNVYQHRACKRLFLYEWLNELGGVNFVRIILS
ncbi:hypothetical protein [Proteus mirabilis]|uniref:hypothetical protein n=1 Tax=Proteus mirabilis TaxID=584 RepID=UPI002574D948|nr:hypothetical protein [Proteus mirabilis]EKU0927464.1 hypothetical protein [Proteus mirabilis]MDM3646643.1 hypothetical protein [Proteus mirabilis]